MTQTVARMFGVVFLPVGLLGLVGGHDVWLHAIIGSVLTAVGFLDRAIPATAR